MKTIYTGNVYGFQTYRIENAKGKAVGSIKAQSFAHIPGKFQIVQFHAKQSAKAEVLAIAKTLGFVSDKLAASF